MKSVAKSSFFHFCLTKQLKLFLDNPTFKSLVSSLILTLFDYCNSLYYGLPETTLHPFTKSFNSAARLVSGTHKFSRPAPTLISLHWLSLLRRSVFKICTLILKIKNNHSPTYLANFFELLSRKELRASTYHHFLAYLPIVIMLNLPFPTVGPFYGTLFHPISPLLLLFFHFVKPLKLCCLHSFLQNAFEQCGSALYNDSIRLD